MSFHLCSLYSFIGLIILYNVIRWIKRYYLTKVSFKDKFVWITGASSGIGENLAYKFSELGAFLIISSRRENELERVKKNCKFPNQVVIFPFDLSNPEEVSIKVKKFLLENKYPIDILINNGGFGMNISFLENTFENEIRLMNVNFFSAIAITREILPGMISRNQGQIILISSILGKYSRSDRTIYSASKHALNGFFDCLRAELSNTKINLNTICPGLIKTNIYKGAIHKKNYNPEEMEKVLSYGMDCKEFVEKAIKSIYLRDNEIIISNKISDKIIILLRNVVPDLIFYKFGKKFL